MWRFYSETYQSRNGELFLLTVNRVILADIPDVSAFSATVIFGFFPAG